MSGPRDIQETTPPRGWAPHPRLPRDHAGLTLRGGAAGPVDGAQEIPQREPDQSPEPPPEGVPIRGPTPGCPAQAGPASGRPRQLRVQQRTAQATLTIKKSN